jgi:tetratricopeptide (TPR) repeat protein
MHMAKKRAKKGGKIAPRETEKEKEEPREFFSVWVLIAIFAVLVLMYPSYQIEHNTSVARAAMEKGDYEKARRHYEWIVKNIAPKAPTPNRELGTVYMNLGMYEKAIECFELVRAALPRLEWINSAIGQCYVKLGNLEEALPYFQRELALNPLDPHANFYVGQALFNEGKYLEAAKHFQRLAYSGLFKNELAQYWSEIEKKVLKQ